MLKILFLFFLILGGSPAILGVIELLSSALESNSTRGQTTAVVLVMSGEAQTKAEIWKM